MEKQLSIKDNYKKKRKLLLELDEIKREYEYKQSQLYTALSAVRKETSAELTDLVSDNVHSILKEWPFNNAKRPFSLILREIIGTGRISIQRAVCYRLYNMGLLEHAKYPYDNTVVVSGFTLTEKGKHCIKSSGCDSCDYKFQCAMTNPLEFDYYYI